MPVGILGRKVGMTQVYDAKGDIHSATVLEAGPCVVLQVKTKDRDGYEAVQIGFDDKLSRKDLKRADDVKKRSRASRAERGHVAALKSKRQKKREESGIPAVPKAGCEAKRFIREFRLDGETIELQVGQTIAADSFDGVIRVDVIGISKGRGFAGVMKRHNFHGTCASHGVKKAHRKPGSIGNNTYPSRVWKGKRMPGHFGHERCTSRNLKVLQISKDENLIVVEGSVPGPNGGYVTVRRTTAKK
jgi:large subunit ribosomal protein L3